MACKNLTAEDLALGMALARECAGAPPIKFTLDAPQALKLVGLCQLALRHPQAAEEFADFVRELATQVSQVGPTFARVVAMGFDSSFDQPW